MKPHFRVLQHVFRSAGAGAPTTHRALCRDLGLQPGELAPILSELERRGLLDGASLRLTLSGLAVAVAARPRRPLLSASLRQAQNQPDLAPVPDTRERSNTVARCAV